MEPATAATITTKKEETLDSFPVDWTPESITKQYIEQLKILFKVDPGRLGKQRAAIVRVTKAYPTDQIGGDYGGWPFMDQGLSVEPVDGLPVNGVWGVDIMPTPTEYRILNAELSLRGMALWPPITKEYDPKVDPVCGFTLVSRGFYAKYEGRRRDKEREQQRPSHFIMGHSNKRRAWEDL